MAIELVRIDDRLIHGQVVTTWINKFGIEQILVISDVVADDPIQKAGIMMTAPAHMQIRIFKVDEFIDILSKTQIHRRTMVILTNTRDALKIAKKTKSFHVLNVGGIRSKEDSKRFTKAVSLQKEDIENLKEILMLGIDVQLQMVPRDDLYSFKELLEKEDAE